MLSARGIGVKPFHGQRTKRLVRKAIDYALKNDRGSLQQILLLPTEYDGIAI